MYGIEPGCGRIRIGQALHPCDTRFFVIMFNRSARSAYFMRSHRSIADEYHLMIVPICVQNVPSGNALCKAAAIVLPYPFIETFMEVKEFHILDLLSGSDKLLTPTL